MATVVLPALFRPLAGGAATVQAEGITLREVLDDLEHQHPALHGRIVDGGSLRPEVFAAINGAEAFGLDAAVPAGAEVHILPAIAGGSGVVVPVLGRELRKCRRQVKLTQIQLAELAGITQSRLSRIETGQVIPRLEQLASLCEALGAELDIRVRLP